MISPVMSRVLGSSMILQVFLLRDQVPGTKREYTLRVALGFR